MPEKKEKHSKTIDSKYLRIAIVFTAVVIILMIKLAELVWPDRLSNSIWVVVEVLVSGVVAYLLAIWISRLHEKNTKLATEFSITEARLEDMQQQQEAVFRLTRNFVEANDEQDVIEQVLRLSIDLTKASGASFVPLDERGHPQAAISKGELPVSIIDPWSEHVAAPEVRDRCRTCGDLHSGTENPGSCPLLRGPLRDNLPEIENVYCLPLKYGERELGMLTLYFRTDEELEASQGQFLSAFVNEMALGLESLRLRRRELISIQQLQAVRRKTDMNTLLASLVENIQQTFKADFAMLVLNDPGSRQIERKLVRGEVSSQALSFIDGVLHGVFTSGEPVFMGDVIGVNRASNGVRALLAAPLIPPDEVPLGSIMVGQKQLQTFTRRQLLLLQTIATQVALVVKNARLVSELEYKTVLEERMRLAREIHDGLAQTIGFLKLQVAQMQSHLAQGEGERLSRGLDTVYQTLSSAYIEIRNSIDGLRVKSVDDHFSVWLKKITAEFEEQTGISCSLNQVENLDELLPEVQVQLIRIIQEALNNIRKHSEASQVNITAKHRRRELVVEITDNGIGFYPEDVSTVAQYGLRGMRERAELMGADFQVISQPQAGTAIKLNLFLAEEEFNI